MRSIVFGFMLSLWLLISGVSLAASGTLTLPPLMERTDQTLGIPLYLDSPAQISGLRLRVALDPKLGVKDLADVTVAPGSLAKGYEITPRLVPDEPHVLELTLSPAPAKPEEPPAAPITGAGAVAFLIIEPKPTWKPGEYALTLHGVEADGMNGSTVSLEAHSSPLTLRLPYVAYGDLNDDDSINIQDAVMALKAIVKLVKLDDEAMERGDVSPAHGDGTVGDGQITVLDAISILRRSVGLDRRHWPEGLPFAAARIGPEGGTVSLSDGSLSLAVPPGALAAPATITLKPLESDDIREDAMFELLPDGLQFEKPATLTMRYDPSLTGIRPDQMYVETTGTDGKPEYLPVKAAGEGRLTVSIPHFTIFRVRDMLKVTPISNMVVEGGKTNLWVVLDLPGEERQSITPLVNWTILRGGGTVENGVYTAPSPAPPGEVVIRAAYSQPNADNPNLIELYEATASVNVLPKRWTGTASYHSEIEFIKTTQIIKAKFKLDFTLNSDLSLEGTVEPTGEKSFRWDGMPCFLTFHPKGELQVNGGRVKGNFRPDRKGGETYKLFPTQVGPQGDFDLNYEGVHLLLPDTEAKGYNPINCEELSSETESGHTIDIHHASFYPRTTGYGRGLTAQGMQVVVTARKHFVSHFAGFNGELRLAGGGSSASQANGLIQEKGY